MRLKAILTLLTTLALASGHPDQWKLDMQDAAQAGFQSWLLDNISELFGFNFNFGRAREKPNSAVEEAMCTADGCSRPTSFELAAEAQSKAIIKKKANTDRHVLEDDLAQRARLRVRRVDVQVLAGGRR